MSSIVDLNVNEVITIQLPADQFPERVDRVIVQKLPKVARAEVQRWIQSGRVLINGVACRNKDKVRPGGLLEIRPDLPPATRAEPDPSVVVQVVFEDEHLLVVDKPPGLVVHPGRGHPSGTLVNGLLARPGFERPLTDPSDPESHFRPGIVHRIDKDTSGLLVVAKDAQAREGLKKQLAEHSMLRRYRAITVGVARDHTYHTLHGRDPRSRLRFSSKVVRGKTSTTHVRLVEVLGDGSTGLVECRLETGRTHQIRVHLSLEAGTPILADALYGGNQGGPIVREVGRELGRQALHAGVLGFVHPWTGAELTFESELPLDMARALQSLRSGSL